MTHLVSHDPFADAGLDDLVRGFFAPVRLEGRRNPVTIRMDVTETPDGYLVQAEMPGVKKDDINVEIEGNQVTLTAEVRREREQKDGDKPLRSERYYGNVYRSFTLPHELDEAASVAKYADGLLELKLIRKAALAGRKLPVM
jgi:HSP20 family protein